MSLRKINRVLKSIGWCLFVNTLDDEDEAPRRGSTHFKVKWIGLPWSKRRKAWDARWMVDDVPHMPELAP